jgi:MinD superfamily P-loop ATPase
MDVVGFFGSKGGTGKSTLSHLLALGAAMANRPALVIHTDAREPERHQERPYHYMDGRDPKRLHAILERAKSPDKPGLCIIDGAGNRQNVAEVLARATDLVLVPCGIGGQDAALALSDIERLSGSLIVVNHWPMPKHPRRQKAERYISQIPSERILLKLGEGASADRFTESDLEPWQTPPARVNSAARALYSRVAQHLSRAEKSDNIE